MNEEIIHKSPQLDREALSVPQYETISTLRVIPQLLKARPETVSCADPKEDAKLLSQSTEKRVPNTAGKCRDTT